MKPLTHAAILVLILTLTAGAALAADPAEPAASKAGVVNINTAEAAQLALLPHVGPKAADRIVEYRKANGPFKKTSDLMQVKGIGDKTFELISPYLAVDGKTTLTTKQSGPKRAKSAKSKTQPSNPAQ